MKNALIVFAICCTFSLSNLQAQGSDLLFSPDQLDNLLAPVALYPDPLLAQVLTAATFVDQIDDASRMLRGRSDPRMIDAQPWDISVKAVAHYPSVLTMMSDKLDWTTSVGQAYVNQSTDVMMSVQRLRAMARNQGNLVSNQQQEVIISGDYISIDPYQAQYIYVPVYEPSFVYYRRGGNFLSFGAGFAIGAWLNYDFNWGGRSIYYTGWERGHGGWIDRSRRYANNTYYINNNYRNVQVNRAVVSSNVNYGNLNRYNSVHQNVNYNNVAAANAGGNRVINRNMNPNDPRIGANRGRQPASNPVVAPAVQRGAAPAPQPTRTVAPPSRAVDTRAASQRGQESRQQAQQPQREQQPQRQAQPQRQQQPQRQAQPQREQQPQRQAQPQREQQPQRQAQPQREQQPQRQAQPQREQQPQRQAQPQKQGQPQKPPQQNHPPHPGNGGKGPNS